MEAFQYRDANSVESAISTNASQPGGKFVAGGTTLIDLMKLNVETPRALVDINHLPLTQVESTSDGGVRIGAMVRNSDLANHELIKQRYPVLSQALLSGASPQLRTWQPLAGTCCNALVVITFATQHTRVQQTDSRPSCAAMDDYNRIHAIPGQARHCIATTSLRHGGCHDGSGRGGAYPRRKKRAHDSAGSVLSITRQHRN